MDASHGHVPGHATGFRWDDYVAWLVEAHGSLAAVAERLAAHRAWSDDRATIERGLRRLRARADREGGTWGDRCLQVFGLPGALRARAAPVARRVPLALHRPPRPRLRRPPPRVGHGPRRRLRRGPDVARAGPRELRAPLGAQRPRRPAPPQRPRGVAAGAPRGPRRARPHRGLRREPRGPARVDALLDEADEHLAAVTDVAARQCLRARLVDQHAWQWNKGRRGEGPDHAKAEALYLTLDDDGAPPFARCRRASGLAYSAWQAGRGEEAVALARAACEHAGDGGHLRLRAMALQMLARVGHGAEAGARRSRGRRPSRRSSTTRRCGCGSRAGGRGVSRRAPRV